MQFIKSTTVIALLAGFSACSQEAPVDPPAEPSAATTSTTTNIESPAESSAEAATDTSSGTRPNILFIVADDIGFTDIGAFGSEIPTPNLDRLAMQGVRLNNLHAAPACQPMRVMLMASAGVSAALEVRPRMESGERNNLLSLAWATIPELLQEAGYATYMTGKWDLGMDDGYTPAMRGFDRSFVQLMGSSSHFAEYFFSEESLGFEEDGKRLALDELPDDFYTTRTYTDKMLEYLESTEASTPWFAYMPYTAPHWPLQLPEDWLDRHAGRYEAGYDALRLQRFERARAAGVLPAGASLDNFSPLAESWSSLSAEEQRRYARAQEIYAGMIEYLDFSIGRVIDYLETTGQLENTVIVFTADHGASSGEHGVATGRGIPGGGPSVMDHIDNRLENFGRMNSFVDHGRGFAEAATAPFRSSKGAMDEGGLRAAAFVRYPSTVPAGGVSDAFMTMMDILPTFMDVAGIEHPGAGTFRGREINDIVGRSAWPHLTGQTAAVHGERDAAGWSAGVGGALIRGGYKIINRPPPGSRGTTAWRLYDLAKDPGEHNDLAAENPTLVAELVAEWEENWQ